MIQASDNLEKNPAIVVENLSKTYTDGLIFRKKLPALHDVSFQVNRGEVFGLLGPNGAGKTTFLKILLGIIGKSSGNAQLLGRSAGSRHGRRQVGYLPEQLRIPRHLTGYTALDFYGRMNGLSSAEVRKRRDGMLEFVGLTGRGGDRISKYSKGMLQRLGLAQALMHEPKLLVLDEPTDGLDPGARAELRQLMQQMGERGVTVFLNSHLLQEVEMVCDRVAILHRGHLQYCGNVRDIGRFVELQTREAGVDVALDLVGEEAAIRQVLGEHLRSCELAGPVESSFEMNEQGGAAAIHVMARFPGQSEVDQAIDRLRAASVSLLRLVREEINLEQAFLKIVARADSASETGSATKFGPKTFPAKDLAD